jgi:hypothetical protein
MVLVDPDQSEQRYEGNFRNYKKRDWNIPGSFIARDRGWDWIGGPASAADHQYPHNNFLFGCHPRRFNHSVDDIQEE